MNRKKGKLKLKEEPRAAFNSKMFGLNTQRAANGYSGALISKLKQARLSLSWANQGAGRAQCYSFYCDSMSQLGDVF